MISPSSVVGNFYLLTGISYMPRAGKSSPYFPSVISNTIKTWNRHKPYTTWRKKVQKNNNSGMNETVLVLSFDIDDNFKRAKLWGFVVTSPILKRIYNIENYDVDISRQMKKARIPENADYIRDLAYLKDL